jgi:molybdopterin-guanine dinucleotide biosynthesis protein A
MPRTLTDRLALDRIMSMNPMPLRSRREWVHGQQVDVIGVVLNGGRSRRMTSDKAQLVIDGQTFLERAVEVLGSVTGTVMVCGGDWAPTRATLVADLVDGVGPLGGLASALRHADGDDIVCLAVDLPRVSEHTVTRIAQQLLPGQARVARTPEHLHPLCGAYAADLADLAWGRLDGPDRSLMGFLRAVPHLTLMDVPVHEMANVNSPDDFERLSEPD